MADCSSLQPLVSSRQPATVWASVFGCLSAAKCDSIGVLATLHRSGTEAWDLSLHGAAIQSGQSPTMFEYLLVTVGEVWGLI